MVPSQKRYRRGTIPGVSDLAQQIINDMGGKYVQRATRHQSTVTTQTRHHRQPRRQGAHPLIWLGVGMVVMLAVWSACVHVEAWYINTYSDPGYYTQTAHRDVVMIKDARGTRSEARAFVDVENHVNLLVIPKSDPSKARIIVGPPLTGMDDAYHKAMLTVEAHGTLVTVTVQGPLVADWLTANRQSARWTADAARHPPASA